MEAGTEGFSIGKQ